MIDAHCHIEQDVYQKDRDQVIEKCKQAGIKAVVFSCARFRDLERSLRMVKKYKGYAFMCAGLHPEFIKEITPETKKDFFETVRRHSGETVAVGETGLDYNWTKESEWRERQKKLFVEMIEFAKELKKPLVVHARDAYLESVGILEKEKPGKVLMHMFGDEDLVERVVGNGWFISTNAIVLRSKNHRKIIKRAPLERILLETDAPWLHPSGHGRNDPTTIKIVAEKIADLKKIPFEDVWLRCGRNAAEFFGLPVKL
jgi:TatD DNase family protein